MDYKTLKNNYEERSEKEHKELIETANKGLNAIRILTNKYSDMTEALDTTDNECFDLGPQIAFEPTDIIREK